MVSTAFHPHIDIPDDMVTHMVAQFGQFLDHDITLTPEEEAEECCEHADTEPACFNIEVPRNDDFFSRLSEPQVLLL